MTEQTRLFARAKEVADEDQWEGDAHPHAQQRNHCAERHLYSNTPAS